MLVGQKKKKFRSTLLQGNANRSEKNSVSEEFVLVRCLEVTGDRLGVC